MHVQGAIPTRPADVINEPQLAELIYKETDARPDADHLGQRFRLALLPKVGQQQQRPRQPLLAGIKHWNVCRSTSFSTINQVVSKRFVKKQEVQWTPFLLQTRTQVLNGDLDAAFREWYPPFRQAAACPPGL